MSLPVCVMLSIQTAVSDTKASPLRIPARTDGQAAPLSTPLTIEQADFKILRTEVLLMNDSG